jgi:hypothetical protein
MRRRKMKRRVLAMGVTLAFVLGAATAAAAAPADFKVPFPLQAGGKKLAAGEYSAVKTAEGGLVLRQASTGKDIPLAVLERIPKPAPPDAEARLVFDEVGDFAPSYTEYVTVYILSEVWFPGEDGYRVHVTKGAHKTKVVTGGASK